LIDGDDAGLSNERDHRRRDDGELLPVMVESEESESDEIE